MHQPQIDWPKAVKPLIKKYKEVSIEYPEEQVKKLALQLNIKKLKFFN